MHVLNWKAWGRVLRIPGDHHFNGDYEGVVKGILDALDRTSHHSDRYLPLEKDRELDRIKRLSPLLTLGFSCLRSGLFIVSLKAFIFTKFVRQFSRFLRPDIVVAVVLTLLSYLTLAGYDFLGLRYLGKTLPWKKSAVGLIFWFCGQ